MRGAVRLALVASIVGSGACGGLFESKSALAIGPTRDIVLGSTVQLVAAANGIPGKEVGCTDWQSSELRVVTVTPLGLATGVALGSATVQASCDNRTVTAEIRVVEVPVVTLSLAAPVEPITVGGAFKLHAVPRDSIGSLISGRIIHWASSAPSVAWVGNDGTVHAVAPGGPVAITASIGDVFASVNVQVAASTCETRELAFGQQASGALASTDCANGSGTVADRWQLTLNAMGIYSLSATSTVFDAALTVLDSTGATLAVADDDAGVNPDAVLLLSPGRYTVLATSLIPSARGAYTLRVGLDATCSTPRPLPAGAEQVDELDDADCKLYGDRSQFWRLTVPARSRVQIDLGSDAFDSFLTLYSESLTFLEFNDDRIGGSRTLDSQIIVTLDPGTYLVHASHYPGFEARGTYRLTATLSPP